MKTYLRYAILTTAIVLFAVINTAPASTPKIKDKTGTSLYKQSGSKSFIETQTAMTVGLDDSLKTLERSTIDVQFDLVNLFRLQENSQMIVSALPQAAKSGVNAEKLYNFSLLNGTIITNIKKLPENTRLEVQTPVAVAGARGTAFAVTVSKSTAKISTLENKVEIISRENIFKSVVAQSYRKVVVAPWSDTKISAVGTGVLSEKILGKMVKESMDKIMLRAHGKGYAPTDVTDPDKAFNTAETEARIKAENNLADIISEIKTGPEKNLADMMFDDSSTASKLFGIVTKARSVETKQNADGSVEVIIEIRADEIQQMVNQKINVWKSIKQISKSQYMKIYPALARVTTERAAKLDAYRRLAEKIYGTVISSHSTLADLALKNDTITNVVQGIVQGASVTDTVYFSDGTIKVTMNIDGKLVKTQIGSASGSDLGVNYISSPQAIEYEEHRFFRILKQME